MDSKAIICPNCGKDNEINAKFCQNCSQKTKLKINSVWRMLIDFIANLIDYDSKLFSSVRGLFNPGFLTNEYLANKRVSYLTPIRLFIFLMVALFFIMSIEGIDDFLINSEKGDNGVNLSVNNKPLDSKNNKIEGKFYTILERSYQTLRFETLIIRFENELESQKKKYQSVEKILTEKLKTTKNIEKLQEALDKNSLKIMKNSDSLNYFKELKSSIDVKEGKPINIILYNNNYEISLFDFSRLSVEELIDKYQVNNWFERLIFRQMYKFNREPTAFAKFVFQNLTWVIFLEVLLLSFLFKLFYIRSKRKYVEHFIMQLHVHSWLFFIFIFVIVLPFNVDGIIGLALLIAIIIYLFMSMKNVYKQGYIKTIIKFLLLSIIDLILFIFSFTLVLLVSTFIF